MSRDSEKLRRYGSPCFVKLMSIAHQRDKIILRNVFGESGSPPHSERVAVNIALTTIIQFSESVRIASLHAPQ